MVAKGGISVLGKNRIFFLIFLIGGLMENWAKQFKFFVTMLSEFVEIMYSISHAVDAVKSHREVRYKPLELVKRETPGEALQKILDEKEANGR